MDKALEEVMVATTAGSRVLKPASSRREATHAGTIDQDEGAKGCPVSEKGGPLSEG